MSVSTIRGALPTRPAALALTEGFPRALIIVQTRCALAPGPAQEPASDPGLANLQVGFGALPSCYFDGL